MALDVRTHPVPQVAPAGQRARYLPIADHGLIGDLHTVALVGTDGTIDWYCSPRFDSPSVFGAILDADRGGLFRLGPDGDDWRAVERRLNAVPQFRTVIDGLGIHYLHARSELRRDPRQRDALLASARRRLVGPPVLGEPGGRRSLAVRYWSEPERGGHFAAFEQPELFVEEACAFFRLVR